MSLQTPTSESSPCQKSFDNPLDFPIVLSKNKQRSLMEAALALIGEDLINVELQFKKDLQSDVPLIRKVGEYVLARGGKRIRPAL